LVRAGDRRAVNMAPERRPEGALTSRPSKVRRVAPGIRLGCVSRSEDSRTSDEALRTGATRMWVVSREGASRPRRAGGIYCYAQQL